MIVKLPQWISVSRASGPARPSGHQFSGTPRSHARTFAGRLGCFSALAGSCRIASRSACLVLRQAARAPAGAFRDQATAVAGTVLVVGAGRYPPPPFFPLLLRQPATATLSTRTSRTAVTISRICLMAHLLVLVSPPLQPRHPHRNLGPRLVRGGCLAAERRQPLRRRFAPLERYGAIPSATGLLDRDP